MRMMNFFMWAAALSALWCGVEAQAQLTWETTEQRVEVGWDQERISAQFPFKNTGSYALTVLSVEPQSKALRATVGSPQRTYKQEQSGAATLSLVNRGVFGEKTYTATVKTDERTAPQVLVLHVVPKGWDTMSAQEKDDLTREGERLQALPSPLEVQPRVLMWLPGQPLEPKTVTITVHGDTPVTVEKLEALAGPDARPGPEGEFKTTLKTVEPGRQYTVEVRPGSSGDSGASGVSGASRAATEGASWRLVTDMDESLQKRQRVHGDAKIIAMVIRQIGPLRAVEPRDEK